VIAAASGGLLSLALPPAGLWPIAYVAPIPFLWLVRGSRPRRGALIGSVFGLVYFGALLYWIALFGEMAWVSLVLLSAASTAAFGALAPAVWRRSRPAVSTVGLASLWTVIEWIRGSFPLGGFGWGQLGTTQLDAPAVPLASVTGVWGLSFAVILISGLILLALERWGRGEARKALPPAVAAVAVGLLPVFVPLAEPDGAPIDVAAIQVDVSSVGDLVGEAEDIAVAALNVERHLALAQDPPDLVVWGEGSLDPGASADPQTQAAVSDAVATVGAPTLAGAVIDDPDGSQHTSTLAFDGSGAVVDRYDKVRLVPFGEYVPWRERLGFLDAIDQVSVDRVPGEEIHDLTVAGLPPIGAPICYENSFPSIDREMVRQGAAVLVVTINNASYERTAASEQHLLMSRLRAVENGRWVVHAAVSGISAFVDERGRVVDSRGLFEPATMRQQVVASTKTTLYTRFGDWVPWGSIVLVLGLIALPRGRKRPLRTPPPPGPRRRTLVILPTFDERATIETVLEGLSALGRGLDVLVVDDASPDGTGEAVLARSEADPHVRLVQRPRKAGLASAYAVGFELASAEGYDVVVEMDSDLSHLPEELPRLLDGVQDNDVVIGSRYIPGGAVTNWSAGRVALSKAGNRYARFCLGFTMHDATSGFRAYRRQALETITQIPIRSDGYAFQVELAYRAWNLGLAVGEVPITFREREHGRSKISRRIVVEALWLITLWGLRARFRPRPGMKAERP
jgi:apolipoprotein N-acyltransferase